MGSEWQPTTLGELAIDLTVGFVGSMASEYRDSGVPFLRSLNVNPLRVVKNDLKFISHDFHRRIIKSALSPGDVVIVRTGKPGTCAVIPDWLPEANCSDVVIVRCGPRLNNRFLAYYVNTLASGHISAHTVGAVQQHFNVGSARQMRIPLPTVAEQEEIVSILGALDDKIALLRETNATLEAIAQALFKSWFVDFDPVRAKAEGRDPVGVPPEVADLFPSEFEDSELGAIPKGWQVGSIYEIANVVYGAPFASKHFNADGRGYPLIRIRDLQTQSPDIYTEEDHPKGMLVHPGALLVGMDGEFKPVIWSGPVSWLNQRVCMFEPKGAASADFVLGSIRPRLEFFERAKVGTTVIHLGKGDIDHFRVVIPPKNVLDSYSLLVRSITGLRLNNASQVRGLTDLRDTLLPRLMSGKLRIPEILGVPG